MTHSILGPIKLASIEMMLGRIRDVPGDLAEAGVYQGGILRELADAYPDRRVFGFDTFKGMPGFAEGEIHGPGSFADVPTVKALRALMPANVTLVPGVFPGSASKIDTTFAFVHVDFDLYESTRAAIEWFRPRMSAGGIMVFDDYRWPHCPGVERAIVEAGLRGEQVCEFQWAAVL